MPINKEAMLADIDHLLHVDGKNVHALDVIDSCPRETLIKCLTAIVVGLKN